MQAELEPLSRRYDVVVANPPYMGSKNMNKWLGDWIKTHCKDVKGDLFSCFMMRNVGMGAEHAQLGFMTPYVWMFIGTYEKLRKFVIKQNTITSLIQLEYSGFSGATVPICTFTLQKGYCPGYRGGYVRLSDFVGADQQAPRALEALANPDCGWFYRTNASGFEAIPGSPIAYWISRKAANLFAGTSIADYGFAGIGMRTGDNARFLRFWFEVGFETIGIGIESAEAQIASYSKWIPYNKGGEFRKWYGNNEYVVNWFNNGEEIKENTKRVYPELGDDLGWKISNERYYFKPGITWTGVTSGAFHCRCYEKGFIFDSGANGLFPFNSFDRFYLAGLLNTGMADAFLKVLNPTINCGAGTLRLVPAIINNSKRDRVAEIVHECIDLAKDDWDAFETSWEYGHHPLVR